MACDCLSNANNMERERFMKGRRSFLLITLFISLLMFITGCWESDKTNTPSGNQNVTLTAITVSPTNPSLNIGETIQFTATGSYSDNSTKNITDSVTWASSNISVSNVIARGVSSLSGGLASAIAPGTTLITATLEGITSPARTLTVSSTIVTNLESRINIRIRRCYNGSRHGRDTNC